MTSNEMLIKIGADAKDFNKEIDGVKDQTKSLEKDLNKIAAASAIGFAALTASVGFAVSKFATFQDSFTNVGTLLDSSSFKTKTLSEGIKGLQADVLRIGSTSGESFQVLNKALFDLISAGFPAEEATSVLSDAVNLAAAGATDTATAVKALTASITAYGREAGTTSEVAQKFFLAQKYGVTTVGELSQEFNKVGGLARQLSIGFNEILSASSALTANGAKPTTQAFSEMKALLSSVIDAQSRLSGESVGVQKALGLQNVKTKGLVVALRETMDATGGNVISMKKLLGSSEALSAALSLTGQQANLFDKILTGMNDKTVLAATFQDALALKQATVSKAFDRLQASTLAVAILIGERLAPTVIRIADSLTALAQEFQGLTEAQKTALDWFVKFVLALGTGVTASTLLVGGFLKVSSMLAVLRTALIVGRVSAIAFWGAMTGGITIVLSFLPEIIAGMQKLFNIIAKDDSAKTVEELNSSLDGLIKRRNELLVQNIASWLPKSMKDAALKARQEEINSLDSQIQKIQELIKIKKQEQDTKVVPQPVTPKEKIGVESGVDLLDEESKKRIQIKKNENEILLAQSRGVAASEIVLMKKRQEAELELSAAKLMGNAQERNLAIENAKLKLASLNSLDEETKKRILLKINENEILKAQAQGLNDVEIGFIKKSQEADAERSSAELLSNVTERDMAIENAKLKDAALLEELNAYNVARTEQQAMFDQLDKESRDALSLEEQDKLAQKLLTDKQIREQIATEKLTEDIANKNQSLLEEKKYGSAVAKTNEFFRREDIKGVVAASGELVALANSKNATMKAIGKTAAHFNAFIATKEGAIKAYTSLVGIPIVGPALGIAAASALTAYGIEQQLAISRAAQGGIVPGGMGGSRDRIPMMLEPGELVTPKALVPDFIQSVGRPNNNSAEQSTTINLRLTENLMDFIEAQVVERRALNVGII
jgi:TP901 family phage tail tape measure protein